MNGLRKSIPAQQPPAINDWIRILTHPAEWLRKHPVRPGSGIEFVLTRSPDSRLQWTARLQNWPSVWTTQSSLSGPEMSWLEKRQSISQKDGQLSSNKDITPTDWLAGNGKHKITRKESRHIPGATTGCWRTSPALCLLCSHHPRGPIQLALRRPASWFYRLPLLPAPPCATQTPNAHPSSHAQCSSRSETGCQPVLPIASLDTRPHKSGKPEASFQTGRIVDATRLVPGNIATRCGSRTSADMHRAGDLPVLGNHAPDAPGKSRDLVGAPAPKMPSSGSLSQCPSLLPCTVAIARLQGMDWNVLAAWFAMVPCMRVSLDSTPEKRTWS